MVALHVVLGMLASLLCRLKIENRRPRILASAAELSGDRFMSALSANLASRHDVALRLLSEVDKEEAASEKAEEEALRDEALSALVRVPHLLRPEEGSSETRKHGIWN